MIGKVPKPGKGFKGLVAYLLHGDRKNPPEANRVAWSETRNLALEDPEKAPALMRATAARSKRVKNPVYHYVISWHHNEAPTDDIMRQVADVTCADLGLSEHQALYIAHQDTKHRHIHIVVNRVHPETNLAWKTSHDYRRIEQSLRRQSESMGIDYVPGRFNDPERFRSSSTPRRPHDGPFRKARRQVKVNAAPARLSQRRRAAFLAVYHSATNWEQFHSALAVLGYRIEGKGQGAVVFDGVNEHKLSAFSKETRLKDLHQRFGSTLSASLAQRDKPAGTSFDKELRTARERVELTEVLSEANLLDQDVHATQYRALRRVEQEAARHAKKPSKPEAAMSDKERKAADQQNAYTAYDSASASLDLAFALHGAGFVDDKQLDRAVRERDAAQEQLNKQKSALDQLIADAAEHAFGTKDTPKSSDKEQADHSAEPEHEPDEPARQTKKRRGRRR